MVGGVLFPGVPENNSLYGGDAFEPYSFPFRHFNFEAPEEVFIAAVGHFG